MAHVQPLPKDTHDAFVDRFNHYENTRGFVPNSILTMQRRPSIAAAFMALNQAVLYEGTVDEELKMLVSLIASQATGCRYCQAHMANLSNIYKASAEKIAAVWQWKTSPLFSDEERSALDLAYHASIQPNSVDESHFEKARLYFSDDEIVEIVASIALFGYLNRWNDTMATDLEEHAQNRANELLSGVDWEIGKHAGRDIG